MAGKACGHWAWLNKKTQNYSIFFCGKSTCFREKCQTLFWSRRVRLVTELIRKYNLTRFFTLTLDRGFISPNEDPWDYIHHPWIKFRHRMNRQYDNFKFVSVLEAHKNKKYPHIHGFTNIWMSQKKWSSIWNDCEGGKTVWIERVREDGISEYVNKQIEVARYVGKENLVQGYKNRRGHRTLWRSKNLKADFELDTNGEYVMIKDEVFNDDGLINPFFKGRRYYGSQAEQSRQNLEATRRSLPN